MPALAVLVPRVEIDLASQLSAAYASVSVEVGAFLLLALILQRRTSPVFSGSSGRRGPG